jgi:predicted amidohydrolase
MSDRIPRPRAVAIQMASREDVAANLATAAELLNRAAEQGAVLAVLPENFACMPAREADRTKIAEDDGDGPIQDFLQSRARQLGLWLVGGTIPIRCPEDPRPAAACIVFDDHGRRRARYDKIHLFDVSIPGANESYRESESICPGEQPVVLDSPVGRLGLAVCYDLRFPELFRAMLDYGVEVVALPAAFTHRTGQAHWETLLRARAIENLCWMIASAQGGEHPGGRRTWGHSMLVDPWGAVVDEHDEGPGLAEAIIDPERQRDIRRRFPALEHRRDIENNMEY